MLPNHRVAALLLGALASSAVAGGTYGLGKAPGADQVIPSTSPQSFLGCADLVDCFAYEVHVARAEPGGQARDEDRRREVTGQVEEAIREAVQGFLDAATEALGEAPVRERIQDLARNSPLTPGRISLIYLAQEGPDFQNVHPHNAVPGVPYPAVVISTTPGDPELDESGAVNAAALRSVVDHEVGHAFWGKFNEGLAEPMADLFSDRGDGWREKVYAVARGILASGRYPKLDLQALFTYSPSARTQYCDAVATHGDDVARDFVGQVVYGSVSQDRAQASAKPRGEGPGKPPGQQRPRDNVRPARDSSGQDRQGPDLDQVVGNPNGYPNPN
jgi:hypothetical protein